MCFVVCLISGKSMSQELEPRLLTNIPVGANFIGVGYSYATGNALLDPSLPVEGLNAKVNTLVGSYVHAFNFFGRSAKVDVAMPWATGYWKGNYEGSDTSTYRIGIGDLRMRLSVNLIGAPALNPEDYTTYNQKTIVGVSIQIIDPIGTYYSDKVLNLGSNRWTFRPQIGVSHRAGDWLYEAYLGMWIFTQNANFYYGNRLTQKPLFTSKVHVVYSFTNGMWGGLGVGYGYGGKTAVNNEPREFNISTFRLQGAFVVPFRQQHTVKLKFESGIRLEEGPDFNAVTLAYQYRWPNYQKQEQKKHAEDFYSYN